MTGILAALAGGRGSTLNATAGAWDNATSGSTLTPSVPVGTQAGDLLVLVCGSVDSTWSTPAGFTEELDNLLAVSWKVATGSEGSTISVTSSGFSNNCACLLRIPAAAFDLVGSKAESTTAGGITMTGSGLLFMVHFDNSDGKSMSVPSGMELLTSSEPSVGGGTCQIFVEARASGATGSRTSSGGDRSVLFAVKAA